MITTNINNSFGLSFKKVHYLGHLRYMANDYENFVHTISCNEIFWCSECTHIPIMGQMVISSFASSFTCKFCHFPLLCVVNCHGQIYYIVHRLPSISKAAIHLEVHKHLVADGKCRKFVDETRRLIIEEVDCMPNVKISMISLGVTKTFLVTYLLNDNGDGNVELLNGEQLEQIQDKFS